MSGLVEFLQARLDEDERVALEATSGPWTVEIHRHRVTGEIVDAEVLPVVEQEGNGAGGVPRPEDAEHIARHHPARVLREVRCKRALLEAAAIVVGGHEIFKLPDIVGNVGPWLGVVKQMASVYSDHPDYDEAWRLKPRRQA